MDPPRFLRPGDRISMEIAGLGRTDNPIAAP
jgi:2-keto-4-pentenoate hydratase/2-oxohepta-3-ene-1,7-dioic acid hydratase in catechol pathway